MPQPITFTLRSTPHAKILFVLFQYVKRCTRRKNLSIGNLWVGFAGSIRAIPYICSKKQGASCLHNKIPQPAHNYQKFCHSVAIKDARRWLHVSGQAGLLSNDFLAGEAEAQIEQCRTNILANLEDADINHNNLVKVTKYVTDAALALL